jgi:LPXTG-motif cell wall-anchored protein
MKKLGKIALALGGLSAICAGFAVGTIASTQKAADAVKAEDTTGLSKIYLTLNSSYWGQANADYYAHIWGGTNGTSWPGISLGSGSGTTTLSGDVGIYSGFTHIIISRWSPGTTVFTGTGVNPWNEWNYYDGTAMDTAEKYNWFSNTAWDSCNSAVKFTILEKSKIVEFGIQDPVSLGFESVASSSSFSPSTPAAKEGYEFSGWFSDSTLNNAYGTNVTVASDAIIYAKYTMTEETYASDFLAKTDAECASKAVTSETWTSLSDAFYTMSATQQNSFKIAELPATYETGTTVQKAALRYKEILKKYTALTNFVGRTDINSASAVLKTDNHDSSSTFVLGGLGVLAILAAGAYFLVRKKKAD